MNVQQKYALQANCKVYKIRRILITKTCNLLRKLTVWCSHCLCLGLFKFTYLTFLSFFQKWLGHLGMLIFSFVVKFWGKHIKFFFIVGGIYHFVWSFSFLWTKGNRRWYIMMANQHFIFFLNLYGEKVWCVQGQQGAVTSGVLFATLLAEKTKNIWALNSMMVR